MAKKCIQLRDIFELTSGEAIESLCAPLDPSLHYDNKKYLNFIKV